MPQDSKPAGKLIPLAREQRANRLQWLADMVAAGAMTREEAERTVDPSGRGRVRLPPPAFRLPFPDAQR